MMKGVGVGVHDEGQTSWMGFRDNARAFSSLRRRSFTFALPSRVPALAPVPIRGAPLPVLADSASGAA